jgi:electron transfer flavoprotein beta subunit
MKVLVFVKPIRTNLIYPNENRREEYTINPYDLLCIQKLIQLREKTDIHITCVSMGTRVAEQILVRCIALGCDEGILLNDKEYFAGSDTYATSNILAFAARKMEYDCIVCGNKSVDGETGQVKYGIAELLKLKHYSDVLEILDADNTSLSLMIDKEKEVQIVRIELPVMLSFREFSVKNEEVNLFKLKAASKKGVTIWNARDLGIREDLCGCSGSRTVVSKITAINQNREGIIIRGTVREQVGFINKIIE